MADERDGKCGLAVVIADGPLSSWRIEFLGIPALQRLGLRVVHFDGSRLLRSDCVASNETNGVDVDLQELDRLLRVHRPIYVFSAFDLASIKFRQIQKLLIENAIPWCFVVAGFIPETMPPQGSLRRAANLWFHIQRVARQRGTLEMFSEFARKSAMALLRRFGIQTSSYPPKYVILEGTKASFRLGKTSATIIPGHSRDYERVLSSGLLESFSACRNTQDYCVFLDSNESGHIDYEILGFSKKDIVDEQWYLVALQNSFKVIEETTGLRVIVLPHPRYEYPAGRFGDREIRAGDTMAMVSAAKLVIGHFSTALAFAVIFNKPVVLLNAERFMKLAAGWSGRYIASFQQALGCPMLSMDDPDPKLLQDWQRIDTERYAAYRDRYIKYPGSPDLSMWEVAVRTITQHEGW